VFFCLLASHPCQTRADVACAGAVTVYKGQVLTITGGALGNPPPPPPNQLIAAGHVCMLTECTDVMYLIPALVKKPRIKRRARHRADRAAGAARRQLCARAGWRQDGARQDPHGRPRHGVQRWRAGAQGQPGASTTAPELLPPACDVFALHGSVCARRHR
jgi:hypothetical protein